MKLSRDLKSTYTIGMFKEKGWGLIARCSEGHLARVPLDYRPEVTVGAIAERLVCKCGSREGQAYSIQVGGVTGTGRPTYWR